MRSEGRKCVTATAAVASLERREPGGRPRRFSTTKLLTFAINTVRIGRYSPRLGRTFEIAIFHLRPFVPARSSDEVELRPSEV